MLGGTLEVQIDLKSFRRPDRRAHQVLRNVAFSATAGAVLALFGPSGIGKSTTLRIAIGIDADFEGHVRRPPGRIGVVFQEPRLAPWLSVADNLHLVARDDTLSFNVVQLLDEVRLPDAARRLPRELSLGMARRAALARALVVAPDILVLDEPFASLDPHLVTALGAVVRARADRGTLVLLVTHELDQALAIADRILVLSGQPATLARNVPVPDRTNPAAITRLRADLLTQFPFLGAESDHVPGI